MSGAQAAALISSLRNASGGSASAGWNPSDAASGFTFSNVNRKAKSNDATQRSVRGVTARSSGKRYLEFLMTVGLTGSNTHFFGFANASFNLNNELGSDTNGLSIANRGFLYFNGYTGNRQGPPYPLAASVACAAAIDFATGNVWFAVDNVWAFGGDPAAGSSPSITGATGTLYPAATHLFNGAETTLYDGSADFAYSPPSGFSAWT